MTAIAPCDAIILAGGQGTRLRELLGDRQKVAAPIVGRSMLVRTVERLARSRAVGRVVVCAGFDADGIRTELAPWSGALPVEVLVENAPLGTAGAVALAIRHGVSDPCFVLNGDSWFDPPLFAMRALHMRRDASATLAAAHVDKAQSYGTLELDGDVVVRFLEKRDSTAGAWINAGVALVDHQILSGIAPGTAASLERDILPAIPRGRLLALRWSGPFLDVGTPERWAEGVRFFGERPEMGERRAAGMLVVVDRDGTLIEERHYLAHPDGVALIPGSAAGLRALSAAGARVVMVTNQSGIARGYFTRADADAVNARVAELLLAAGVRLDGVYLCPHVPGDRCACRKPAPGLVEAAVADMPAPPTSIWVIGDKACDVDLARAVGGSSVLVGTGHGATAQVDRAVRPSFMVPALGDAADLLLAAIAQADWPPRRFPLSF